MLYFHKNIFLNIEELMIGFKNELLEVVEYAGKKYKRNLWKCICKCNNIIFRLTTEIQRKKPASCLGCVNKNHSKPIHGLRNSVLYNRWNCIKQRCYNEKHPFFKYYGLKGIKVCDEWKNDFKKFYEWCISNNFQKGLVIDRINNNKDYEPQNCRFITPSENTRRMNLTKNNRDISW